MVGPPAPPFKVSSQPDRVEQLIAAGALGALLEAAGPGIIAL